MRRLVAGTVAMLTVAACAGPVPAPLSSATPVPPAPVESPELPPGSADASAVPPATVELPAADWSNPESDPTLRNVHEEACRAPADLVTPGQWAGLVRVVEQQRSGWPFHLYWDGGTFHVACFAPPYDPSAAVVTVMDWANREPPGRKPGFATLESVASLPRDERRMGWGTAEPVVAEVRVAPSGAPSVVATSANGYFLVQWPLELGEDRNAPRLEAYDACGEKLVADDTRTPCPAP